MSFVEPLQARRLCAVTPDASFASGGRLSFSLDLDVDNVLATHGQIYVEGYQRPRNRSIIFKYNDNGMLDTTWGRNGYVVPHPLADMASKQIVDLTMVRDPHTGGLLVGAVDYPASGVAVLRYTEGGALDGAWGHNGRVAYSETKTEFTLSRLVALPHKKVLLAFDREQQLGDPNNDGGPLGGAQDVALLKFDARGRYDRTFNGGHALTVAAGNYHEVDSVVGEDEDEQIVEDSTVPTFRDIQFFASGNLRVVSTRQEMHQTTTIHFDDLFFNVGRTVFTAESVFVTADGHVRAKRSKSYVLKRGVSDENGNSSDAFYQPQAAAADLDGVGISVLAETDRSTCILRVGPGYRSRPEVLPAPFDDRYLYDVRRTGDGTILAQTFGTDDDSNDEKPHEGPAILSLGRDLTVGGHRVVLAPTYFPEFSFDPYTFDDQGRLLAEDTNTKTNTFELTRYA